MSSSKERGPSAYNTALDELPEYFALFSPWMWVWLLEIMLMLVGGGALTTIVAFFYFPSNPEFYFFGIFAGTILISIPNFMLVQGKEKGIFFLKILCLIYIIAATPNFFLEAPLISFIPIASGVLAYWITTTEKFRAFVLHRKKMTAWSREQLEKNKIRKQVIKERMAKQKK